MTEIKFGWCVTGHHGDCRRTFHDWNQKLVTCTCECHKKKEAKPDAE